MFLCVQFLVICQMSMILEDKKRAQKTKNLILDAFIRGIESRPLVIDEFDERLWAVVVDSGNVMSNGLIAFKFKDSSEITI